MISPGKRRGSRLGVALAAAGVLAVSACGTTGTDTGGSSATSTTSTSTTTSTTSTTLGTGPGDGTVPGACTAATCPDLQESPSNLMRGTVTSENADIENVNQFLGEALDDLDQLWGQWFTRLQWGDVSAGRVLIQPGRPFAGCPEPDSTSLIPVPSDEKNAYFCPGASAPNGAGVTRQGVIVLPVETFVDFWHGEIIGSPAQFGSGEFAAAVVVAHEYGHNVMHRIADRGNISAAQYPQGDNPELLADCFAGNWAASALRQRILRPDDLRQAVSLVDVIGDPEPGQGHGTKTDRALAIQRGFGLPGQPGEPVGCLTTYWPELFPG